MEVAALSSRPVDEVASAAISHALTEDLRFLAAVKEGLDAADRGHFFGSEEVWAGIEEILRH